MFKVAALVLALGTSYSDYPAFVRPGIVVEMFTDKGVVIELVVRCPDGTGILTYSKAEALFCSSKHQCFRGLSLAVDDTCGGRIK